MRTAVAALLVAAACGGTTTQGNDAGLFDAATDSTLDYGQCGKTVRDCMCACNGVTSCESACYTPACTTCIDGAATTCCPTEYPAYTRCLTEASTATDGGPAPCAASDSACVLAHCQAVSSALQTCLAKPACTTAYAVCNGTVKC